MVYLRELTRSDIPIINTWRQSRELQDFFGSPFRYINLETDEEWFERYMKNRTKEVRLAIVTKDENELIGMVSIANIDAVCRKAEYGGIMIGVPFNRGKGIGKLVTMMLLRHVFYDLNLNRFEGVWLITNRPSIEMGKKCGFKEEGVLRQATYKNGQYHDLLQMSILRMEFDEIAKNYKWL